MGADRAVRIGVALVAFATALAGVELKKETTAVFDRYVAQAEARIEREVAPGGGFLFAANPERRAALRTGAILTEPVARRGGLRVPSGLIHDWAGAVFIPGVSLRDVLAKVQAYDQHTALYAPDVVASRVLARQGEDFTVYMRLLKKKALTVAVLDTEHAVRYRRLSDTVWWSSSRSTRIAEVENPGSRTEQRMPPGTGHGYLWRLNSYWTFHELDGGMYVECEAISLTRDVPRALSWILTPIVRDLPRESLLTTLKNTRAAVARK